MKHVHACVVFCFVVALPSIPSEMVLFYLPISFRVASQALGQSYDCSSACESTLKDMDKING